MKLRRFLVCLLIAVSVLAAGLAVWLEVLPRIAYSKRIKQFDCYQVKEVSNDGAWRKKRLEMSLEEYAGLKEKLLRDKWYDETQDLEDGLHKPAGPGFTKEEYNSVREVLAHVYTPYPFLQIADAKRICERICVMILEGKVIIQYESYLTPVNSGIKW